MKRVVVAFVVLATLAAAAAASGGVAGAVVTLNNTTTNDTPDEERFGTSISTFMAASAANANGTVDQEMWEAAVNGSTAANTSVSERVQTLQQRLDRLAERRQELLAAYRNGTIPEVAFEVRMASLNARYQQLAEAANSTAAIARAHNVTPPGLTELVRSAARAAAAHGPPADVPRGPPNATPGNRDGQGPPENHTTGPDNRTTGPPENHTTGPDNRTTGPPNDSQPNGHEQGPPANPTTGPDNGTETPGTGNGTANGSEGDDSNGAPNGTASGTPATTSNAPRAVSDAPVWESA